MFASLSKALAPGFHCLNESDIPILFVMSQLSPLHWDRVEPGNRFETWLFFYGSMLLYLYRRAKIHEMWKSIFHNFSRCLY